jgi:hypothetical protein
MDRETERLVKRVKRELRALKAQVENSENHAAMTAYEEMTSALD